VDLAQRLAVHVARWTGEAEQLLALVGTAKDLDPIPYLDVYRCLHDCAVANSKLDRLMVLLCQRRNSHVLSQQAVLREELVKAQDNVDLIRHQLDALTERQGRDAKFRFREDMLMHEYNFDKYIHELGLEEENDSDTTELITDEDEEEEEEQEQQPKANKENELPTQETLERTGAMRRDRDAI